jgi:Flp pilus assembly protein TadG
MGADWTVRPSLLRRGQITILVGGIIVVFLLLFFVVGMDFVRVYYVRGELQAAADSAALAGVRQLGTSSGPGSFLLDTGTNYQQLPARQAAWQFACRNRAAHQNVFLEQLGSCTPSSDDSCCNMAPTSGLNEGTNDSAGDIVIGYWSDSPIACSSTGTTEQFCPANGLTNNPINAVKVRDQRVTGLEGSGRGAVGLLFGKLVGWTTMDVKRQAIATRLPLTTPGISLCVMSCDPEPVTGNFILQTDSQHTPIANGMAWTVFDCSASVNANDVRDFIWGRKVSPGPWCGRCITTNNGVAVINDMSDAFHDKTFDSANKEFDASGNVTKWTVAIPVIDTQCGTEDGNCNMTSPGVPQTCPPGAQGMATREPSDVSQIAVVEIEDVVRTGVMKGILVGHSVCTDCSMGIPAGKRVALVK